jgi:hypothetical protein
MKLFALSHAGVTIVGDPDQSIYGWRSAGETYCDCFLGVSLIPEIIPAEVENLNHMKRGQSNLQTNLNLVSNLRSGSPFL